MEFDYSNVGLRIKLKLAELNLKQIDLCEITGLSKNGINQYVTNKRFPDTVSLHKISIALNVSMEYLLTGKEKKSLFLDSNDIVIKNELIEPYKELDEQSKENVIDFIAFQLSKNKKINLQKIITDTVDFSVKND